MHSPTKEQVKATRESAGLTQAEAAALLYLTVKAWGAWEQGVRRMSPGYWELFNLKIKKIKGRGK